MNATDLNKKSTDSRTQWEVVEKEKKAYMLRKQEEREQKRALDDFLRHCNEEEGDGLGAWHD